MFGFCRWRIAESEVIAKCDVKNNGIVRNPSQDSDVSCLIIIKKIINLEPNMMHKTTNETDMIICFNIFVTTTDSNQTTSNEQKPTSDPVNNVLIILG